LYSVGRRLEAASEVIRVRVRERDIDVVVAARHHA
jgi:hypothetical protein